MVTGPAVWLVVFGVTIPAGIGLWLIRLRFREDRHPERSVRKGLHAEPQSWAIAVGWAFVLALVLLRIAAWWWLAIASVALIEAFAADVIRARRAR